jgi:hypothetical protein
VTSCRPYPKWDHFVVNARLDLAAAGATFEALGFHLTPPSTNSFGATNRLAVFGDDYLELLGVGDAAAPQSAGLLALPRGLVGLVFGAHSAAAAAQAVAGAGGSAVAVQEFSRPVRVGEGEAEAAFRIAPLPASVAPFGWACFCEHRTPELVWRDEWRAHPNGALAIAAAVIVSARPDETAAGFRDVFGPPAVRPREGGWRLSSGLGDLEVLTPKAAAAAFGSALPDAQGRAVYMAALQIRTRSLAQAREAIRAPVTMTRSNLRIDADAAFGLAIEFIE